MNRVIFTVVTAVAISACNTYTPQPPAMLAMPNDCANIEAAERWLQAQSDVARAPLQSDIDYEQIRGQFRHRLWTLRYYCRPV